MIYISFLYPFFCSHNFEETLADDDIDEDIGTDLAYECLFDALIGAEELRDLRFWGNTLAKKLAKLQKMPEIFSLAKRLESVSNFP